MYVVGFQARLRSAVQVVGRAARTLSHGWTSVQSCAVTPLFLITVATVDDRSQSIRMWSVQSQAADKAAALYQFTYAASHASVNFVLRASKRYARGKREGIWEGLRGRHPRNHQKTTEGQNWTLTRHLPE